MGLEIINILKKQQGLTSKQLSEKSKVPIGTLNKILNGQTKNPAYETVFALATALNCSVDTFYDDKKEKKSDTLNLSKEENQHILDFRALNDIGKKKVVTYTKDLLDNLKYQKNDELPNKKKEIWEEEGKEHLMPVAAHMREGATEEDIQYDNDLMNDDSLWDD